MATFSERIKLLRNQKGWSQQRMAEELGISKSSVNMYERGEREPGFETMEAIADMFNVDMNFLYGKSDIRNSASKNTVVPPGYQPMPELVSVPLIGRIACGDPITAEENLEGHVSIPAEWHASFTLMCAGASMEPSIHDGDLVAIRSQPTVENGQIAAVRIDNEATLKRVYLYGDHIELRPENPEFPSIIKIGEDMNDVHIEGKAVGLCRGL